MSTNLLLASSERMNPQLLLPAYDTIVALRNQGVVTTGGFQTVLEQDYLEILLRGKQRIIVCPARSVDSVRRLYNGALWKAVKQGMEEARVTLESPFPDSVKRATKKTAIIRNTWMVERADAMLVLHAMPGGETERMARLAVELGKPLATLDHAANQHLIDLGAYPTSASDPLLAHPDQWGTQG